MAASPAWVIAKLRQLVAEGDSVTLRLLGGSQRGQARDLGLVGLPALDRDVEVVGDQVGAQQVVVQLLVGGHLLRKYGCLPG